jgi:ferredoxin
MRYRGLWCDTLVRVIAVGSMNVQAPEMYEDEAEALRRVVDYVKRGEKVVLVGCGVWELYNQAFHDLRMSGENFFLLDAADCLEASLGRVPFAQLVMGRVAYTSRRRAEDAVLERSDANKPVTRRALLRTGFVGAAMDYTEKPIEDELCSKNVLRDYCDRCIKVCGVEGGCAASAAYCGIELLHVPGYSRAGLHDFLRLTVRDAKVPGYIVFAPRTTLARMLDEFKGESLDHRLFFVPVSCPYVVGLEELLAVRALGLEPIIVAEGEEESLRRCKESRNVYEKLIVSTYVKLTGSYLLYSLNDALRKLREKPQIVGSEAAQEALSRGLRPLALLEAKRLGVTTKLAAPFAGVVIIDQSRCTLCSACARECPSAALRIRESKDVSALLFLHDRCIACRVCEKVCPENALRVEEALDPRLIGGWTPLYMEEVVRCIVCGKPIGPRSLVERVVEKLIAAGFKPENMPTILMCDGCKQKYNLGLIERDRIDWDYLRSFVARVRARMVEGNS